MDFQVAEEEHLVIVDTLLSVWILVLLSSEMGLYLVLLVPLRKAGCRLNSPVDNGGTPRKRSHAHLTLVSRSSDSRHSALVAVFLWLHLWDIC